MRSLLRSGLESAKPYKQSLSERLFEGEHNAIATESFIGDMGLRIREAFGKKEREFHEDRVRAEMNLKEQARLFEMVRNKDEPRPNAPPIKLGAYAKWLSIDGNVLVKPVPILDELARIDHLMEIYRTDVVPQMHNILKDMTNGLLREATDGDPVDAYNKWVTTPNKYFPKKMEPLLTKSRTRILSNTSIKAKGSADFLGGWWVGEWEGLRQRQTGSTGLHLVFDHVLDSHIKEASILPWKNSDTNIVLQVIKTIVGRTKDLEAFDSIQADADKFTAAMVKFERAHSRWEAAETDDEKAAERIMMAAYTALYDFEYVVDLSDVVNHVCRVVMKVCEGCIHRMD